MVSSLEWIANGQVETVAIIEAQKVVKALLSRVVRNMKADTPIHTNDEQAQVVANAHTSAHGHVGEHALPLELSSRPLSVVTKRPNVASIEEDGTIEIAKQMGTELQVGHKLHVAGLLYV